MHPNERQESTDLGISLIGKYIATYDDIPNGWNKPTERNIRSLGEKAAAHAWMHDKCVTYFNWWSKRLSVIAMVLSVISGTGALSGYIQEEIPRWAFLIFSALSYCVAILGGIDEIFKFDDAIMNHKVAYTKYLALYHNIQKQLALRPDERQAAKDYYSYVLLEIDSLAFYSPHIIDQVVAEYKKRFKNHHTFNIKNTESRTNIDINMSDTAPDLPVATASHVVGATASGMPPTIVISSGVVSENDDDFGLQQSTPTPPLNEIVRGRGIYSSHSDNLNQIDHGLRRLYAEPQPYNSKSVTRNEGPSRNYSDAALNAGHYKKSYKDRLSGSGLSTTHSP